MNEALLALISVLIAAMVWVVKNTAGQNKALIETLTQAVAAFSDFKDEEQEVHGNLAANQAKISETQADQEKTSKETLELLRDIHKLTEEGFQSLRTRES